MRSVVYYACALAWLWVPALLVRPLVCGTHPVLGVCLLFGMWGGSIFAWMLVSVARTGRLPLQ